MSACDPRPTDHPSFAAALAALRQTAGSCPEQETQRRYTELLAQLSTIIEALGGIHLDDKNGAYRLLNSLPSMCPSEDWRLATNLAAINPLLTLVLQLVIDIRARAENLHSMVQADFKVQRSTPAS